jgi:hypothetical protein
VRAGGTFSRAGRIVGAGAGISLGRSAREVGGVRRAAASRRAGAGRSGWVAGAPVVPPGAVGLVPAASPDLHVGRGGRGEPSSAAAAALVLGLLWSMAGSSRCWCRRGGGGGCCPVARSTEVHRRSRLVPPGCDLLVGEALLATVTPAGRPAVTRWQLATELVADVGQLEQRIAAVQAHSKTASPRPTPACWSCSGSGVPHGAAASKSRWPVPHPTSHRPIYGWSTRPSISPDPSHRVAASPLHSRSGRWAVHGLGWPSRHWTPPWTGNSVANLIRGGGGHGTPQRGTRPPRL